MAVMDKPVTVRLTAAEREMARSLFPNDLDPLVSYARQKLKMMQDGDDFLPTLQPAPIHPQTIATVSESGARFTVSINGAVVGDFPERGAADRAVEKLEACALDAPTSASIKMQAAWNFSNDCLSLRGCPNDYTPPNGWPIGINPIRVEGGFDIPRTQLIKSEATARYDTRGAQTFIEAWINGKPNNLLWQAHIKWGSGMPLRPGTALSDIGLH